MKKKYFGLELPMLLIISVIIIFATQMGILSQDLADRKSVV